MFGSSRRHRPPVQPLTRETANPNAATAAASAFMRRDQSAPPSLSSAAAAAALKARPTTPTNVADVQSKRAARRSPSVSSINSRDGRRPGLQRSPSTGSLSERTFRSPSPGRGQPLPHDVPPVPALPRDDRYTTRTNGSANRQGPVVQTQPFRTASQKLKDGQRGSWFTSANPGNVANVRKSDSVLRGSNQSPEARPGSPSINFSYPRAKSESPDAATEDSLHAEPTMVYDANSRRMVPKLNQVESRNFVREASEVPAKKKKKQNLTRSGSHLSKGTVGRTKAPALETKQTAPPPSQVDSHETAAKRAAQETGRPPTPTKTASPRAQSPVDLETVEAPLLASDTTAVETIARALAAEDSHVASPGRTQPSPAQQQPEPEASVPVRSEAVQKPDVPEEQHTMQVVSTGTPVATQDAGTQQSREQLDEAKGLVDEKPAVRETRQLGNNRKMRVHSESPARMAHFAPAADHLLVRHEPPPRSLSPRKSALKQRSPSRGVSPSDDGSEASAQAHGLNSTEDTPLTRKKSARVSFNDENTVILGDLSGSAGVADSPTVPSPQAKKPWHSLVGRHNKKDSVSLEEEETMTPRPALPLFGSVRDKKVREPEERPLVRPAERVRSPAPAPSPVVQMTEQQKPSVPQTGDQYSRNEANTSKYREPLPPVVTSIEGSGYVSNSDSNSEDEVETGDAYSTPVTSSEPSQRFPEDSVYETLAQKDTIVPQPAEQYHDVDDAAALPPTLPVMNNAQATQIHTDTAQPVTDVPGVPDIAISEPTPLAEDEKQLAPESRRDFFGIPGEFPDYSEDSDGSANQSNVPAGQSHTAVSPVIATREAPSQSTSTNLSRKLPPLQLSTHTSEMVEPSPPSPQMADIQEEEDSTDANSIYSDAYEDMSEAEGDGFMSLDAVVTSPIGSSSIKSNDSIPELTNARVKDIIAQKNISVVSPQNAVQAEKQSPNQRDWENAKAYWKSLTAEERRQLEREATEDAGAEADVEEEPKPAPKAQTKATKKVNGSAVNGTTAHSKPTTTHSSQERTYQIQPGTRWSDEDSHPVRADRRNQQEAHARAGGPGTAKLRKSLRQEDSVASDASSNQPGTMRKSMRSAPQANGSGGHMQKTMRAERQAPVEASGGMRKSLRGPVETAREGAGTDARSRSGGRPASYQPPPSTNPAPPKKKRTLSLEGKPAGGSELAAVAPLVRRGSDASESSFTRARPNQGDGFGFRRTMRGNARETGPAVSSSYHNENVRGSGRFSLRSLSPTGSHTGRRQSITSSPAAGGRMRQSLRSSSTDAASSRIRMPSFGRSSGKKSMKQQGSRFGDSSDEEGGAAPFRSRFADSSDEEDVAMPLPQSTRTTRPKSSSGFGALPVQREEEDSPDLPDSDDDDIVQSNGKATTNGAATNARAADLQRSGSGRGNLVKKPSMASNDPLAAAALRPSHARRGSFMSAVLRRKRGDAGKISRNVSESAARRDTKLERSTEELTVIRSNSNGTSRLQRRPPPNWPLQDAAEANGTGVDSLQARPSTATEPPTSTPQKMGFLRRRSNSHTVPASIAPTNESGEPAKKKRFGTLRKMFKIQD
ncbi:hypothetical protein S7711_00599 [Stachybotrys chartarum IBT 7711]|uniref:Uncharacterized protein n=1 Tax=Stachybotrys chartarum (strain CBS 109288 / IBT 7711) TaxID=1280523 RepID=A0A084ATU8_STACB|nr:hypothetical protein S7711_00599 [Stachybotrys chartarum IBT 7711]